MRRDSFERFYYEKVALEGCGCAEYVTTRIRDLDALAVKAEARDIASSASEYRPVWLRLADRIRMACRQGLDEHMDPTPAQFAGW